MQLDAYAIRKMAPRLLIAVVAVNLSIYLCLAAVDIANIVGRGIGQLLITPFADANVFDIEVKGNATNGIIGGAGALVGGGVLTAVLASIFSAAATFGGAATAVGVAGVAGSLIGGVLPFLFLSVVSIGFVALAVLLTVIIRQGLIVFLIVISPIAIALFVLPGTEKYFRQWWSIFMKTLMVYPIIAVIFAMSDVLGAIILKGAASDTISGGNGLAMIMTGIIVVYAPLFLIPFAFKFAGGVLGAMYDVAQGQTGKANGGLRNKIRQSQQDPNSWLGGLSKRSKETRQQIGMTPGHVFGGTAAGLSSMRRKEGFRRGYAADASARSTRLANKSARESQELDAAKEIGPDDDTSKGAIVAARGGSRAEVDAELAEAARTRFKRSALDLNDKDDAAAAMAMGWARFHGPTGKMEWVGDGDEGGEAQANSATAIAARNRNADQALAQIDTLKNRMGGKAMEQMAVDNISTTTTGYKNNAEMTKRVVEASRRADGSVDMQQVGLTLGRTKKAAMQAGRVDYGGSSFTRHYAVAQALANGTMDLNEAEAQLSASVIKKQSAGTLATMDTRGMEVMAPHLTVELEQAMAVAKRSGKPVMQDAKVQMAAAKVANLYDSLNYANSGNADILSNVMGDKRFNVDKNDRSIREVIETMRGDDKNYEAFANIRKDWGMGRSGGMSREDIAKLPPEVQAKAMEQLMAAEAAAARGGGQERQGGP